MFGVLAFARTLVIGGPTGATLMAFELSGPLTVLLILCVFLVIWLAAGIGQRRRAVPR